MKPTNLIIGVKANPEGKLDFELLEAAPNETTIADAVERRQSPEFDYIAAVKAYIPGEDAAEPKDDAA